MQRHDRLRPGGPAMIAVVAGRGDGTHGWRLVSRTGVGADVLARAGNAPQPAPPRQALEALRDGAGAVDVVRTPDGHHKWVLTGHDGAVVAESPPIYREAGRCRAAYAEARRAARVALAGLRPAAVGTPPQPAHTTI